MRRTIQLLLLSSLILPIVFGQATPRGGFSVGKEKDQPPLANPSIVTAGRDDIVKVIQRMLEEQEVPLNVEESKPGSGILVTQKYVYSKGTHAKQDLEHFANVLAPATRNWTKARVLLTFQVDPIDANHAQLFISGKFEGLGGEISGEWIPVSSKGVLEDCFMHAILEKLGVLAPSKDEHLCLKCCNG